jgi:F-type H+-transporting ATPase subunit delta
MLGASRTSLAQARARLTELAGSSSAADLEQLSEELFAVATLLEEELPLRRTLADPSTPEQAKVALVEGLFRERVAPQTLSFLVELVRSRWSRPRDLADAVETLAVVAAFAQANEAGTLDEVEDQIFRFSRIVERDNPLREALDDEALPGERKRELLTALLADKVDPVALRIITAAAVSSGRRRHLGEGLDTFAWLAADLRERLNARVTVAVDLDDDQAERLADELSRVYGKRIGLRIEVDPDILGGAVVRVGDQVLDGSIARRLDLARRGTARL